MATLYFEILRYAQYDNKKGFRPCVYGLSRRFHQLAMTRAERVYNAHLIRQRIFL